MPGKSDNNIKTMSNLHTPGAKPACSQSMSVTPLNLSTCNQPWNAQQMCPQEKHKMQLKNLKCSQKMTRMSPNQQNNKRSRQQATTAGQCVKAKGAIEEEEQMQTQKIDNIQNTTTRIWIKAWEHLFKGATEKKHGLAENPNQTASTNAICDQRKSCNWSSRMHQRNVSQQGEQVQNRL